MPRHSYSLSLFLVVCCIFCASDTYSTISGPVIALHAKSHTTKGVTICGPWAPSSIDCTEFTTAARTGVPYEIYVVGVNPDPAPADGVAGIRWSIDYNGTAQQGVDVFSWTGCGDSEFPWNDWPGPKTGNTLVWTNRDPDNCQRNQPGASGAQGVAGAFYVYAYSEDVFSIFPFYFCCGSNSELRSHLQVADCRGVTRYLDFETDRGAIRFSAEGNAIGFNPCTGEGELPPIVPPVPPPPPPPPPPPTSDQTATLLLHVGLNGNRGGSCADAPADLDSVKTSAPYSTPGTVYGVYLLATPEVPHDPVGISGIQMGIEYSPSLQVQSWITCGPQIPFGNWPASGSGNTLFFDGCQSGEIEVGGYFQVAIYDPSVFRIIGHPLTGLAKWGDCSSEGVFQDLSQARVGWISMGGAAMGQDTDGCNPAIESCGLAPVAAHHTTWGRIKSKY